MGQCQPIHILCTELIGDERKNSSVNLCPQLHHSFIHSFIIIPTKYMIRMKEKFIFMQIHIQYYKQTKEFCHSRKILI